MGAGAPTISRLAGSIIALVPRATARISTGNFSFDRSARPERI